MIHGFISHHIIKTDLYLLAKRSIVIVTPINLSGSNVRNEKKMSFNSPWPKHKRKHGAQVKLAHANILQKLQARTLSVKELKRKNVITEKFSISYEKCSSEYSSDEDGLVIQPVVNRDPAISEVLRIVDKATEKRMLNIGALRKKKRKRKELFPSN